jgi:hypothetical protein|tara:strand:- start:603 stop:899 length:297 start_codon:yes stop_codon:yes gene_type:complete
MKWKETEDVRDYDSEARNLIRPLSNNQCYDLYDIVLKKIKMSNSVRRDKELNAVKKAIENLSNIDRYRLKAIMTGYKGSMAQDARPKDGQTDVNRKKV